MEATHLQVHDGYFRQCQCHTGSRADLAALRGPTFTPEPQQAGTDYCHRQRGALVRSRDNSCAQPLPAAISVNARSLRYRGTLLSSSPAPPLNSSTVAGPASGMIGQIWVAVTSSKATSLPLASSSSLLSSSRLSSCSCCSSCRFRRYMSR